MQQIKQKKKRKKKPGSAMPTTKSFSKTSPTTTAEWPRVGAASPSRTINFVHETAASLRISLFETNK